MQDQIKKEENISKEIPIEGTVFQEKESKAGPIIGSIIIILIILVGGIYFWSQQVEKRKIENERIEESSVMINTEMSAGEEIDQIENSLELIDLDQIEKELNELDKEFEI